MHRKWLAAAAGGAVATLLLSGCVGSGGSASGSDDKTINYWGFTGGISSVTAKSVIQAFEKSHPGYRVNTVVMNTDDIDVKLPTALGRASGPDLVYTGTEPNHLGRYVQAGKVLSLKPYWTKEGWNNLSPSTQKRVTYNGEPYAVGNELESVGLLYNATLFQQLGLTVPTSLADLEKDMARIKQQRPDVTPMDLACGGPCYSGLHMMHALGYATIPTKEVLATTPVDDGNYTDPAWTNMLTTFQQWNADGYFTKDASGIPDPNHQASFCAGTTAMMASGPWEFSGLAGCASQNPGKFSLAFAPFPVDGSLPFQAYVGTGKAWFLSAGLKDEPKKRQAVMDLVHAMTEASAFPSWLTKDQLIPAMTFDPAKYDLTEPQKQTLQIMTKAGANGGAVDIGFNNSAAETNLWVAGLQGILSGNTTPKDLVAKLQAQLEIDRKAWKANG